MPFDFKSLAALLVCPRSKAALVLEGQSLVSVDPATRLRYEVRDEIPVMLVDEATEVPLPEWQEIMRRHGHDPATGRPLQEKPA